MPRRFDVAAGLLGLLGVLCLLSGLFLAAQLYGAHNNLCYSPLNRFVSELGSIKRTPFFWVFSLGVGAGSLLAVPALLLSRKQFDARRWRFGVWLSAFSAFAGAGAGLLSMDWIIPHNICAFSYFSGWFVASGLFASTLLRAGRGAYAKFLGGFCLCSWLLCASLLLFAGFFIAGIRPPGGDLQLFVSAMRGMARPDFIPSALIEWLVLASSLGWMLAVSLGLLLTGGRGILPGAGAAAGAARSESIY